MKELFFKEDGSFKIVQFTDIHYQEDGDIPKKSLKLMNDVIEAENPDFIMITGDAVFGEKNRENIPRALASTVESGIPWSFVFGNHDTEEGAGYDVLFPLISKMKNCCLYDSDPSIHGVGNHILEIKNNKGEVIWALCGIDSGTYCENKIVGGYNYIHRDQIEWYVKEMSRLKEKNKDVSVLTFLHIPLPEYQEVWDRKVCYGERREKMEGPNLNSGFFSAMVETGCTKGVFAGHDHINDYMGELYGITLAYGRCTGYQTYGEEGFERGGRVIVLNQNDTKSFRTYVRLESGRVIDKPKKHMPKIHKFTN